MTDDEKKILAEIDDLICDLYSGQDRQFVFKEITPKGREQLRKRLDDILDLIRPLHSPE